jgi:phosphoglycolate phosphatase-like HAD superfamily hydrolase
MAVAGSPKLFLFDIDGTLLSIAKRELNVFSLALEQVFGTLGPIDDYSFAGKTDHQIAFELLSRAGRSVAEIESGLKELKNRYFEMLNEMLGVSSMEVLPGVIELLDGLAQDPGVVLGLQTGNWEVAAEIKLSRFSLDRYFLVGAFGDGHLDRNSLPSLARQRAERQVGNSINSRDTVIIGDTALDVACARTWDMVSVGVATGSTNQLELRAAGADLVVPTLAELEVDRLFGLLSEEPA